MTTQPAPSPRRTSALQYWPLVADCALVFVLLALGTRGLGPHLHHGPVILLLLGLVVPLFFRRRVPLTAFAVIAAVAFVQWWTFDVAVADAALLVALYSVAVSSSLRRTLAAAAVLELGVLLAVVRYTGPQSAHTMGFIFLSGLVTAAGVLGANVRVRRAYLHEVEQRAARLELERDQQAQLAVAAERARVAREMHDIVAHNVSVMIALTDGAALTLAGDPDRAAAALAEASRAGRAALTDMRRVLGLLRHSGDEAVRSPAPAIGDLDGLLEAVRHTGIDVRYETTGRLAAIEPGAQLSVFRIVQEAITNTLKHADQATLIDIRVIASSDGVEVRVADDGRPQHATGLDTGHGLVGMRERAAVHSGEVQAGATATGWSVRAWLPSAVAEPAELVVVGA